MIRHPVDEPRSFALAVQAQGQAPDWLLVHGTITGPDHGPARRVHAWLEREGQVYDPRVRRFFSVGVYRRIVGAVPAMRYRYNHARQWSGDTGQAGPWGDCCLADAGMLR
jgi:hypothetical protein